MPQRLAKVEKAWLSTSSVADACWLRNGYMSSSREAEEVEQKLVLLKLLK